MIVMKRKMALMTDNHEVERLSRRGVKGGDHWQGVF